MDGECENLYICDTAKHPDEFIRDQLLTSENQFFQLKITTPFDSIRIDAHSRLTCFDSGPKNIKMEEQVSTIIMKSVTRSLSFSNASPGGRQSKDGLQNLVIKQVNCLPEKYKKKYDSLSSGKDPLVYHDDIKEITENIILKSTQKIKLYHKNRKMRKELRRSYSLGVVENLVVFFMWFFGIGEELEADYVEQLLAVIQGIKRGQAIRPNAEKEDLFSQLAMTATKESKAFLLEKLLMLYEKDRDEILEGCKTLWTKVVQHQQWKKKTELKQEMSSSLLHLIEFHCYDGSTSKGHLSIIKDILRNLDSVWDEKVKFLQRKDANDWKKDPSLPDEIFLKRISMQFFPYLTEDSREDIEEKIKMFKNIYEIRDLYGKQCYIGFSGPQNAGKSTLLNELWGNYAKTGMNTHTKEVSRYEIANGIYAIDFPGSNSLDDALSSAQKHFGHMNNFQVNVIPYNGDPDKDLIANVKMAYRQKQICGKSFQTLFCLNKAATSTKHESISFGDEYRKQYVKKIRDHISKNPYDTKVDTPWKRLKEKDISKKSIYEEITHKHEKLKNYTIEEIKEEHFIFTDWKESRDDTNDIKGVEDVRKRIQDFLVKSNILSREQAIDSLKKGVCDY